MIRSQDLIDRYRKTETEIDELGRTFVVGLLKPSDRATVLEMLGGNADFTLLSFLRCASVRSVTDTEGKTFPMQVPKTREELLANLDLFDAEGVEAIGKAMLRLDPPKKDSARKDVVDEAKN